jgi:hypothetical protein
MCHGKHTLRRKRVAILHQGFIPVYRVKFYELLNRAGAISYVVFHDTPPRVLVITRCHHLHAPEVEYIEPGQNGLVIPGDFDGFGQTVVDCLNGGHHIPMSAAALKAREPLTLDHMVRIFHEAVATTLDECGVNQS